METWALSFLQRGEVTMKERTIFDEIEATKRLIADNRETIYMLNEAWKVGNDELIRDREIIVKGLELYLGALEHTVNAQSRRTSVVTMDAVISNPREN
jgi:hypothetical protein